MAKRRLQTTQDEKQISPSPPNKRSRADRWWMAGILTIAIIVGGVIGSFSLPGGSGVDARFVTAFIGIVVFLFLGGMLIAGIESVRVKRQSGLSLFCWSVVVITSSIFGFFLLPSLLIPLRVFLGACIGYIGLFLLRAFVASPADFLGEIMKGFVEDGCCLGCFCLFIAITGTISSLLIWHSVLLSVCIGGFALVALIAFPLLHSSPRFSPWSYYPAHLA
jgi:hypothetical protein